MRVMHSNIATYENYSLLPLKAYEFFRNIKIDRGSIRLFYYSEILFVVITTLEWSRNFGLSVMLVARLKICIRARAAV